MLGSRKSTSEATNKNEQKTEKQKTYSKFDLKKYLECRSFSISFTEFHTFGLEIWIGPQMVFEHWLGLQIVPG